MRYDVVVWGATGFTGELVAAYLLRRIGVEGWAMAGRSLAKLEAVRGRLAEIDPAAINLPLLTANADDEGSLRALAAQAKVVCTTVGPYAIHGSKLVAACVAERAQCCDLTGEVHWMKAMIDAHHAAAQSAGVRIVHACGFDSIPSDMGTWTVQQAAISRHGGAMSTVRGYLRKARGTMSGGTIASLTALLAEAAVDPSVRRVLANPYCLLPEGAPRGPRLRDLGPAAWDAEAGGWTGPFLMAATNAPVVRRSHALAGSPLGAEFRYSEVTATGPGPSGWVRAQSLAVGLASMAAVLSTRPGRAIASRFVTQPGDGPDEAAREAGSFVFDVIGTNGTHSLTCRVAGDKDPGYGATAGMLAESALALALDDLPDIAGVVTPSTGIGQALARRLPHAGVTLTLR